LRGRRGLFCVRMEEVRHPDLREKTVTMIKKTSNRKACRTASEAGDLAAPRAERRPMFTASLVARFTHLSGRAAPHRSQNGPPGGQNNYGRPDGMARSIRGVW
jgi:hypothetical protein